MMSSFVKPSRAPFWLVCLVAAACGGGNNTPSSSDVQPSSPVAVSTPAATPVPTALPGGCRLPLITQQPRECPRQDPHWLDQVDQAITRLQSQRPDIFDGQYVLSPGQYYLGVMANLNAMGLCANFDGEEIQVTDTTGFSDQYHIMTSGQIIRRGDASYRATCYPPALPTAAPVLPPRGDCKLPPSRSISCNRETQRYLAQVQSSIQQLLHDRPDLFNGDYVLNPDAYYAGLVQILKGKMACAIFDGEEIAVKNDNNVSEQYHVMFSWGQIRNDEYSYRASCYPATF